LIKRAGEGHVVNISSVFGLIGVPSQSAYCAAKFAVRGFTESLREELLMEGSNVGVTCVHPGGIKTNIARRARMRLDASWGPNDPEKAGDDFERLARTTPEGAARDILDAILNGRPRQLIGADARMIDWMQRLLPQTYQRIVMYAAKKQRERRTT
jgi:short-subunit dehydrogenase